MSSEQGIVTGTRSAAHTVVIEVCYHMIPYFKKIAINDLVCYSTYFLQYCIPLSSSMQFCLLNGAGFYITWLKSEIFCYQSLEKAHKM